MPPLRARPQQLQRRFLRRSRRLYAAAHFPDLAIKPNPNGNGVRPPGSRVIYFEVPHMLRTWPNLPRPRMSLLCRDGTAPLASGKIMLGGWGVRADSLPCPPVRPT